MKQTANDQNYKKESTPVVDKQSNGKSQYKPSVKPIVKQMAYSKMTTVKKLINLGSVALFLASTTTVWGANNRPNILFILSDDHAWQAVSAYGESRHLIQTPNIDRLAQEGMRFDRFS